MLCTVLKWFCCSIVFFIGDILVDNVGFKIIWGVVIMGFNIWWISQCRCYECGRKLGFFNRFHNIFSTKCESCLSASDK